MELKPGYKQTEIGTIPENWNTDSFDKLGSVIDGDRGTHYPSEEEFSNSGFCLFLNAGNVTKNGFNFRKCAFINREKDALLNNGKLKRYDIILTTRGTVGNIAYFDASVSYTDIRINSGMVILRASPTFLDAAFFYTLFQSHILQVQIDRLAFGSAQPQLTVQSISKLKIVVPPLPEQRAIATALSDMDALLAAQDQLIAKKCDIKQAVMQQLLTGKQRLPGFSGAWETKRLGDVGSFSKGKGLAKESINLTGTMPAIPYTAIYTDFDEVVRYSEIRQYTNPSYEQSLVKGPVLLIASSSNMLENIGKATAYVDNLDVAVGGDIILYKSLLDVRFLAYLLSTRPHRANIRLLSQGSTIRHVYSSTFSSYKLALPPLDEQAAIAAVLSDMDAEIDALQQRRDKTRALKQGMMQELLTGRTRLV